MSPRLRIRRDPRALAVAGLTFAGFWLFRFLAPLVTTYLRRSSRNNTSAHLFRIVSRIPDEPNRHLVEARLIAALDLLATLGPVHLRWLQRRYQFLFLAHIPGDGYFQHVPDVKLLRIHPSLVWRMAPEGLAVELAGTAAQGRLRHTVLSCTDYDKQRLERLGDQERVWLARRVPEISVLGTEWQEFLAHNPAPVTDGPASPPRQARTVDA